MSTSERVARAARLARPAGLDARTVTARHDIIVELYTLDGLRTPAIGRLLGISPQAVAKALHARGVPVHPRGRPPVRQRA